MNDCHRSEPNLLITGTPGVGKTRLCIALADQLKYFHHDISKLAKDNDYIEDYDEDLKCPIIDDDKVLDHLEPIMSNGGNIVDYHGCEFFPERWFDVVFVMRCSNTTLFDRLTERNYEENKLQSNIEAEIFETILQEAKESYDPNIVHEIRGESLLNFDENIENILKWIVKWKEDNN